ncbi:MAG: N-acylneuraminate-9-phosphate synthase, partial [Rhodospirillaceae bacterium]|nr:N-acylneuraminate-9-phosphate synthase [Rhodospirillaceae bacterium]
MMFEAGFHESFSLGDRKVGPGEPVLFIAEAGVSHFGDIAIARDLVDLAADAKADVFKTQFFDVEEMIAARASEWRDRLRPRNLTLDQAAEINERCASKGMLFMATAHDPSRIPWLEALDVPAIKVGSGERSNPGFLTELARLGKPMVVSTGMYSASDVAEALRACRAGGCDAVALLHCVTAYPTPDEDVNLGAMDVLGGLFGGPVGYSDHTPDHAAILAAVARGARVIEKHITTLFNVPNAQDWKVSAGPDDLPQLVAAIRRTEKQLGHGRKEVAPSEMAGQAWALKSLVAGRDLPAGHVLAGDDLMAKRPGDGIHPNRIDDVLGMRLKQAIA